MQSFVLVSFVGTLALLAAHVADYAVEIMRGPVGAMRVSMPDHEAPIDEVPLEMAEHYVQAA
jgi:hypothetical protein